MAPEHTVVRLAPAGGRHHLAGGTAGVATAMSVAAAGAVAAGASGMVGGNSGGVIPCPLLALTGLPCPFCGMTHALIALGEGDLSASLSAAPAVPLLAITATAVIIAVAGRGTRRGMSWPAWITWTGAVLVAAAWIAKVAFLGPA